MYHILTLQTGQCVESCYRCYPHIAIIGKHTGICTATAGCGIYVHAHKLSVEVLWLDDCLTIDGTATTLTHFQLLLLLIFSSTSCRFCSCRITASCLLISTTAIAIDR